MLLSCAGSGPSSGLLPDVLPPGHGIDLDHSEIREARALRRASQAIDAGNFERAQWELSLAGTGVDLAGYRALERARLFAASGEFEAAATEAAAYRAAVSDPALVEALAAVEGDSLMALGEHVGAQEAWRVAWEISPDSGRRRDFGLAIIQSLQYEGDLEIGVEPEVHWESVFPAPEEAVAAESPAPETALARGDALMASGRGARAIEAYREALAGELAEEDVRRAQFQLGLALFRLRVYDEALAVFAALEGDAEARLWHARSLARTGQIEASIVGFEELAQDAPPRLANRARYLAATLLEDQGETERAVAHYAAVVADEDSRDQARQALWRIGWLAWRAGDYPEARMRFEELVEREPDALGELKPRYWAARAAVAMGQRGLGRSELAALAREWPLSYYGWRAQQRLGRPRVSTKTVRTEIFSRPSSPADEDRMRRALLLLEAGYLESARYEIQPLLKRPCSLVDCIRLGSLLAGLGDFHGAQQLVVRRYPGLLGQGLSPGYEALFWLSWPPAYADSVHASLAESGRIDPALVWAIMREESGFRPGVMSSAGAMGLLQLMPETARQTADRVGAESLDDSEELFVPGTNIALGTAYLDYLAERFPSQTSAIIASYNAGPNAVAGWRTGAAASVEDDVWVEDIPYAQTRSYVRRVLRSLHAYRNFY
ncbi:MAG: tetratricopeptide repeat protein [Myxococcota bacterium]|nr:tetratricopeptide repeat protein [Myxococcota bacterium]